MVDCCNLGLLGETAGQRCRSVRVGGSEGEAGSVAGGGDDVCDAVFLGQQQPLR
jgi:hypothetical protein